MKKSKGFILIETLMGLFISSIVMIVMVNTFMVYINIYRDENRCTLDSCHAREAFMIIEENLSKAKKVEIVDGNKIKLSEGNLTNYIQNKRGKLVISYYKNKWLTSNNIMCNINEFKVIRDKNLVIVNIVTNLGEEFKHCFHLEKSQHT